MTPTLRDELPAPHRVWLAGFMGAGKSTVGRRLAEELGWEFVDTDDLVEQRADRTIPDLFEEGEAVFREFEREAVRQAGGGAPRVIALGGGALQDEDTREFIRGTGLLVYLQVGIDDLVERLQQSETGRPLVEGRAEGELRERVETLMRERVVHYESADLIVASGAERTVESIVKDLNYAIDSRLSADPRRPG